MTKDQLFTSLPLIREAMAISTDADIAVAGDAVILTIYCDVDRFRAILDEAIAIKQAELERLRLGV